MIIFKRIRYRSELGLNLPPGTKVSMAPKGSMTSSVFVEFIKHFAQHKVRGKCLLIFDGAKCRLSNEAMEEADKSNIVLYSLPSNTTHELQLLDKSVPVVAPPISKFIEVSELSSPSLIDESRPVHSSHVSSIFPSTSEEKTVSTSPKFSAATKNRKQVLVPNSSSTDVLDME